MVATLSAFSGRASALEANLKVRAIQGPADALPGLDISGSVAGPLSPDSRHAWFAFAQVRQSWAQSYMGVNWTVRPWLSVWAAAGVQQNGGEWLEQVNLGLAATVRDAVQVSIDIETDRRLIVHGDIDALWYELALTAKVAERLSVGMRARSGFGTGPYLEAFLSPAVRLFAAWLPVSHEIWRAGSASDLRSWYAGLTFVL